MVRKTGRFSASALVAALAIVASVSSSAQAQTISSQSASSQVGFTGGFSVDPEQGVVGVFWRTPELGSRFHLRPGVEGGFGDGYKVATINVDFLARFPLGASGWELLQGAGPAIVITRFDAFGQSHSDLSAGGSYVIGFGHDSGFLTEFRIGGGNVPTLKLVAGFALAF